MLPQVKKLSRLCPACPASLSEAFILDQRGSDGILALGLFELYSNLQYKEKIMPYLLDVLKSLPLAKWIEAREPALQSDSPLAGEFAFAFVTLMSGLAAKDNSLEGDIVKLQLNLFNTLVDQCCAYQNLTDNKKGMIFLNFHMLLGYTSEPLSVEPDCPDEIEATHQKQVQVLIRDSKHSKSYKNMWLSEGSTIIVEPSDIILSSTPLKD